MTAPAVVESPVTVAAFREALGAFASGVTVVTTTWRQVSHGMTVSAFCSLSLDPPLVLVCLAGSSRGRELIVHSGVFSVNVLAADQAHLSALFARRDRPRGRDAFDGLDVRAGSTGCPVLTGAVAHVDCLVRDLHDGGDHTIVVGSVVSAGSRRQAAPLLYHRSGYHRLDPTPAMTPAKTPAPGCIRPGPGRSDR